jgi:8-oxo-dGTP pyrophosphatase MutT (NUDIX family)
VSEPWVEATGPGTAQVHWVAGSEQQGTVEAVRALVDEAWAEHLRVEAHVGVDDITGQRIATWSGLRREGIRRHPDGDAIVYARLADDPPVSTPDGFRALLNSFLPRKRAISQMLIRDPEGRVLLCQLTYKKDWDLPGGVVEVGESPQLAVAREVEEELGLELRPGALLLTDWLPPWGGWDDALCLVWDGGVHEPGITEQIVEQTREIRRAEWATLDDVQERCADFTARRIEAALAQQTRGREGGAYSESGVLG